MAKVSVISGVRVLTLSKYAVLKELPEYAVVPTTVEVDRSLTTMPTQVLATTLFNIVGLALGPTQMPKFWVPAPTP